MMKLAVAISPKRRKFAAVPLQGEISDILALAREIGYDGVELNLGHPNEVDAAALRGELDRHGLKAISIATGAAYFEEGLCLTVPEPGGREKAIERIRVHCDLAAKIGAKVVVGMMRGRLSTDEAEAERQVERFAESLARCASAARDVEVTLMVEPMNRYETNFLTTAAATVEFLDRHGRNDVEVMLDTFHMNIEEFDLPAACARTCGRLGLFQTVDSNRCAPGMGHIDFGALLAVLAAAKYDGFLSAEVVQQPDGPSAARIAYRTLSELLRRLGP
jgi:sugar phosphate isomerase/epimerase